MTIQEEHNLAVQRVVKAIADLGEHFDAVQIFVTKHARPDEQTEPRTFTCHRGVGNWNARYGQVLEWVTYEEERIRHAARNESAED